MPDDLTNAQIAVLCDIGEFDLFSIDRDRRRDVGYLLAQGYIEPTQGHPGSRLKLSAKGVQFLSERGAGLNEA